jgi:hypothetical protein
MMRTNKEISTSVPDVDDLFGNFPDCPTRTPCQRQGEDEPDEPDILRGLE